MNRIILAEDDPFLMKMCRSHLEFEGFSVTLARDGAEAIALIDKEKPDILLLDLLMPKVDGFGVLQHIKDKGYTFPIFLLSNLSVEITPEQLDEFGVLKCFIKSELELEELAKSMRKIAGEKAKAVA